MANDVGSKASDEEDARTALPLADAGSVDGARDWSLFVMIGAGAGLSDGMVATVDTALSAATKTSAVWVKLAKVGLTASV